MTEQRIFPVTQRFVLNNNIVNEIKNLTPNFGFNGLGEVVFRRTYSRNKESWHDVVIRVIEGVVTIRKEHYYRNSLQWNDNDWQNYARDMALSMFKIEWLPPGRGLWMMGTDFVYNRGGMALFNCFSVETEFLVKENNIMVIKSFKNYLDGDKVSILGRYGWKEGTVKNFGIQKLWKLVVTTDVGITSKTIYTTENHRWLYKNSINNVFTKDLEIGKQLATPKSFECKWFVKSVEETDRIESIWCVVEPENEEFTLECGILTKNCAATDTKDDLVLSAEWTMDALMNGVGVGFSVNWRGNATKPNKEDKELYIIPDSREGWVISLIKLMCSYIESPRYGKNKFPVFDYSQIRLQGLPIKGFGGLSSGPDPLKKLHDRVEKYLDNFCNGFIEINNIRKEYNHTRLVADIFNAIGACVVAGNVRRSAEISLGDAENETFVNLKNYELHPERGEIGWMSNNSVVLKAGYDYNDFLNIPEMAARIRDNGEPGMINLYNIQKFGRYGKEMKDDATLVNPCGEITPQYTQKVY